MKNIIDEKPQDILIGRPEYIVSDFVDKKDIENKTVLDIGCGFGWFLYNVLKYNHESFLALKDSQKNRGLERFF